MSRIIRRLAARQDLVDIAYYYISQGSPQTAERFRNQAESLFLRLVKMPGIGTFYDHDHPALAGIRFFPVSRFPKYLVFYRSVEDGIEVIRVLHGARDIDGILAVEFAVADERKEDA